MNKTSVVLLCLMAFWLSGCAKDALDEASNDPGKAKIMIVQASPNTIAGKSTRYNLVLDGINLYSCPVSYANITGYFPTAPGTKSLQLDSTGQAAKEVSQCVGPTATVGTGSFSVEADKFYSVFVLDTVGSIKNLVLEDNFTPPTRESGTAVVRFVNTTPDAMIDVVAEGGEVLFSNVAFGSYVDFMEVKAGVLDMEIRRTGSLDVLKKVENVALEAGKVYTLFSRGFASPKLDKDAKPINPVELSTIINYYIFP